MKEQSELTDQPDGSPQKKKSRKKSSRVKVQFSEIDDNSDEIIGDDTTETVWASANDEKICVFELTRRDAIVSCLTAFVVLFVLYVYNYLL